MPTPLPKRRSVRLENWSYREGTFLVTIVTHRRRHLFGAVRDDRVLLSRLGRLVDAEWLAVGDRRSNNTALDGHVVMPNHLHAIIHLYDLSPPQTHVDRRGLESDTLGSIVGGFKAAVTARARRDGLIAEDQKLWQRSFHDAALRTDRNLADAREYVRRNPELWASDPDR